MSIEVRETSKVPGLWTIENSCSDEEFLDFQSFGFCHLLEKMQENRNLRENPNIKSSMSTNLIDELHKNI